MNSPKCRICGKNHRLGFCPEFELPEGSEA